jgi:hypothetical protein
MKTSELTGVALDWAVAKCEGRPVEQENGSVNWPYLTGYSPSTNWAQGGPIIEREELTLNCHWQRPYAIKVIVDERRVIQGNGPTPLIAAMRCYVASKLGDEVEIPEELT